MRPIRAYTENRCVLWVTFEHEPLSQNVFRSQMPNRLPHRHILILADIEGSSGCGSYRASSFLTRPWAKACAAMSRDVDVMITG